ncbi:MAG: hypothetical protein RJA70_1399 [Pseudomonadota bacterium]
MHEVPLYELSGEGQHLFVRVEKRGFTTQQMLLAVAKAANVRDRDIGFAGMKDKHAITSQWISLLAQNVPEPSSWQLPQGMAVVEVTRHGNKLRTGHAKGNRFRIRLVGVDEGAEQKAEALVSAINQHGLLNYFGAQRFGSQLDNLEKAITWLREGDPRRTPRFLVKLYPSVIQSEVFNRYLSRRAALGFDHVLQGEVLRLNNSASVFVVTDPEQEKARLLARDTHHTGPIWGPKMKFPEGEALALEQACVDELSLDDALLKKLAKFGPGTRRDLLIWPEALTATVVSDSGSPPELELQFTLPSGAYATEVIRQFTRDSFSTVRGMERVSE